LQSAARGEALCGIAPFTRRVGDMALLGAAGGIALPARSIATFTFAR